MKETFYKRTDKFGNTSGLVYRWMFQEGRSVRAGERIAHALPLTDRYPNGTMKSVKPYTFEYGKVKGFTEYNGYQYVFPYPGYNMNAEIRTNYKSEARRLDFKAMKVNGFNDFYTQPKEIIVNDIPTVNTNDKMLDHIHIQSYYNNRLVSLENYQTWAN